MNWLSWFKSQPSLCTRLETPFPTRMLFVLALCRICEPIAFMSIFPYIYYMVQSFDTTESDQQISIYAGLITSAFAFAEFFASIFWGWLSDRIGRKPVLLTGLAGTGISMLLFGFAKSLPTALLARILGGLLNGNIGVILTTVGEVVTEEAHQSGAFAVMPFVWCLGSIIGAAVGGSLADPVKNYSFDEDGVFHRYPYLLPNLVCTAVVVFGLVVGFLFLEETHQDKKNHDDVGLRLGRWLTQRFHRVRRKSKTVDQETATKMALGPSDKKINYHTITSPLQTPAKDSTSSSVKIETWPSRKLSPFRHLTIQVKLIIVSYGVLAFHTICLEQLLPILFASSPSSIPPVLPFKFDGGFDLPAKTIGLLLSSQGILQAVAQIIIFPIMNERFGSLTTFRVAVFSYPFLYLMIPYLVLVPYSLRGPCVLLILVWKVTAQSLSFPSQSIMLANAAHSKRVLGTLNGIAMSAASLARAIGPTVIGIIHATGLQKGFCIISWWSCGIVAAAGSVVGLLMVSKVAADKGEARLLPSLLGDVDKSRCQSSLRS